MLVTASARADTRVHSYAYVTNLTTDYATSADEGVRENRCDVTALLPHAILKDRPKNDDRSPLHGATLVEETVRDPNRNCDDYLHTWQPVDFDPAHRDDVHFTWPHGKLDLGVGIIYGIVISIFAFALVVEPLRYRWRIRRRPDRRYRDQR
jgi:hypothetical protein